MIGEFRLGFDWSDVDYVLDVHVFSAHHFPRNHSHIECITIVQSEETGIISKNIKQFSRTLSEQPLRRFAASRRVRYQCGSMFCESPRLELAQKSGHDKTDNDRLF